MFTEEEISKARPYRELFKGYGTLRTASGAELEKAITDIASNQAENAHQETTAVIRSLAILSLQNQKHIDKVEARNEDYTKRIVRMTKWTIALAVVSIICSVVQIVVALRKY
jgi:hypothetical protein